MVRHETCLQYFYRRLREGWQCVSIEGYDALLLSPDGILRELNLRNDVETIRPSAAGDECNISSSNGCSACPNHYDCVDEAVADDDTTYVVNDGSAAWRRDLYNLDNHSVGSGTINKITLYFRVKSSWNGSSVIGAIKSDSTVTQTAQKNPYSDFGINTWGTYSEIWATNPADAGAWQWADIDSLQAGVNLYSSGRAYSYCTQVYVEVDYTPVAGWTNISHDKGVAAAAMSHKKGVAVADISHVKGVAV